MIALLLAIPVTIWDFSISNHAFVPSGDVNQWEHGMPTSGPGGPEKVWGTNLGGFYLNDSVDYLEVPLPDLAAVVAPSLVFKHWYAISLGDSAWIEVDVGNTGWVRVDPVYGYPMVDGFTGSSDWIDTTIALEPFSGTTRVRFAFEADTTIADDGWYLSEVTLWDGDATPPRVTPVIDPGDTQNVTTPYKVQVVVEDDGPLVDVTLTWSTGGADSIIAMTPLGNGLYQALIPAQAPDSIVTWQVFAVDAGANATSWPPVAPDTFRVFLAAPTGLTVSYDERPIGEDVKLSWSSPASPHLVRSYTVQDVGGTLQSISVSSPSADLVIQPNDPQLWHVAAVYDHGVGDWSPTVDLNLEVPTLTAVAPSSAIQGETIHLTVTGASLYLLEGATTLDLGPGIDVLDLDVRDVNTLDALVFVHGSADAGLRDMALEGGQGGATFEAAFEVLDQALAMRVVSVTPSTFVQGQTVEVVIEASEAFAGPVQIQHGDDLVLLSTPVVSGTELRFEMAVQQSATPGLHTIIIDDGARMIQAPITVTERVFQISSTGCQTLSAIPLGAGGLAVLALLGVARRRRG